MRQTVWRVGVALGLILLAWDAQTRAQSPSARRGAGPPSSARVGNPWDRGTQWLRDKLSKPDGAETQVDLMDADAPPAPPAPPRSVLRSTAPGATAPYVTVPNRTARTNAGTRYAAPQQGAGVPTPASPSTSMELPAESEGISANEVPTNQVSSDDLRIQQRIRSVEQMLKGEEARLQQQLAQYGRMRETALKKEDANALRQIEQMERQTVATYQKRLAQVLSQMPAENESSVAPAPTEPQSAPPTVQATRRKSTSAARGTRYRTPYGR